MKNVERILKLFIREEWLEEIIGDLLEYQNEIKDLPGWKQWIFIWFHASQCLRPSLLKPITGQSKLNTIGMFKLNFKIALRSYVKNRMVTINSLLILILGSLCFQSIYAWLSNENDMNGFHQKLDRLYITTVKTNPNANLTPLSHSTLFRIDYQQFPEVEQTSQIHVYSEKDAKIATAEYDHWGSAFVVDSNFFQLFDFPFQSGDPNTVLLDPSAIVLTQSYAKSIFGNENPMGKILEIKCDHVGTYEVAGILKDIPSNSAISFDFVLPRHSKPFWRRIPQEIVLTNTAFDAQTFNEKITSLGRANNTRFPESELSVYPLKQVYQDQPFTSSFFSKYGDKNAIENLTLIAIIILIITGIGYNNLQSTRLLNQSHQLGIKYVLGSNRSQLQQEFWISRGLLCLLAIFISWSIFELSFDYYSDQLGLGLDRHPVKHLFSISFVVFAILSSTLIVARLQLLGISFAKSITQRQHLFRTPRFQKGITVLQFGLTTSLLIASFIVILQSRFMQEQPLGYQHSSILSVDFFEMQGNYVSEEIQGQTANKHQYIQQKLHENPKILNFSQGDLPIQSNVNPTSWRRANVNYEYTTENMMIVDPAYDDLLGLKIRKGRFFSDSLDQNNQQKVVINEAAMKYWGISDLSEDKLQSNTSGRSEYEFDIIGIVEDFHYQHLSKEIKPLVMRYRPYTDDSFLIRVDDRDEKAAIDLLEELFNEINPSGIFSYTSLNDQLDAQYDSEHQLQIIYGYFTITALILSCLGLFTYTWHEVQRRTKEIGIRKVLGASFSNIFQMINLRLAVTIAISFALAFPLAYYFQITWLDNYAYRVNISGFVYFSAALISMSAGLLATVWLTWKISRSNPTDSLRTE